MSIPVPNSAAYAPHTASRKEPRTAVLLSACMSAVLVGLATVLVGGITTSLLAVFLAFTSATLFNYRVGVIAVIVLLPLSATRLIPREILGIKGLNPLNGVFAMTAIAVLLICAFFPRKVIVPKVGRLAWIYVGVLVAWAAYGALHVSRIPFAYEVSGLVSFAGPTGYLRDIMIKPLIILSCAYLLAIAVANARQPAGYLVPLFTSSIVLPFIVIGFIATGKVSLSMLASAGSRGFLSFLGIHANELGLMFNMGFALALFSAFAAEKRRVKMLLAAVSVCMACAVVLTFSRGAFVGVVVAMAFLLIKQRRFTVIVCALLVLPFVALLIPDAVVERATTGIGSRDLTAISAGRISGIWLPLLPEFFSSPIFGQGMSSVLWSDAARRGSMLPVGHPHSAYLGMLLDFGVVGSMAIASFFVYLWRYFTRVAKEYKGTIWAGFFQGACGCILILAAQGLTDDRVTPTLPQVYLWLAFGIAVGLNARASVEAQYKNGK